ncbi:MAG: pitrilysin family protein [Fimbriimonadaceae bacterium]|nr:pitrilysin family protein [Fimbriimonadaceae bacterium]
MKLAFARAGLALLALGAVAVGTAQSLAVEKYKLPNGLTVILHEDRRLPVVTINTWFRVGSKDEPDRRSGFAHLFEHLMFMGTKRVPNGQFDQIMERAGGSNNATTDYDRTNYFSSGPSTLLPTLLYLDAERLEALGENIDQKKLDLQRDVVKNERRQSVENSPYGRAYDAIPGLMYPKGHPYSWSVIGSMEDLTAATVDDVKSFFSTYYVPNNATLVVAGDFDSRAIKPMIASFFGSIRRGNDVPRRPVPPVELRGVKRVTMVDDVEQSKTIMAWHSPAAFKPGDAELRLTASILADGVASRLYERLVTQEKIASEVSAYQQSLSLGSNFFVEATLAEGASQDQLESSIDAVLRQYAATGPTADELRRAVAKIEKSQLQELESLSIKADRLNEYDFYLGEPNAFATVLETYRKATPESVKAAVANSLGLWNRLVLRVIPHGPTPEVSPLETAPTIGPLAPFNPDRPVEIVLNNGVKVLYWRRDELPLIHVMTVFNGGRDLDAANEAGLTAMTAEMLTQGAGTRRAADFRNALDLLGADISASATNSSLAVSLSTLTPNLGRSLALYADAIRRPRFDPTEWERVQRIELANLEQERNAPRAIAIRTALANFFGPEHPYGRLATDESLRAIAPEDLRLKHTLLFQPSNATMFVTGNLPGPAIKFELEKAFAGWAGTGVAPTASIPKPSPSPLRVFIVDQPGAVQTVVRFYAPGSPYASPERIPNQALGTILGGTFTSRLNQNLREEKGYTYGANARFTFDPAVGYLTAGADVRTDVTGAALKEFLAEFKRISEGGVTEDEVRKAVSTMQTNIIESLSTSDGVLATMRRLHENRRAFGSLSDDVTTIRALSKAVLDAQASRAFPFGQGVLVLVGDKRAILPQLEGLGLPTPVDAIVP